MKCIKQKKYIVLDNYVEEKKILFKTDTLGLS